MDWEHLLKIKKNDIVDRLLEIPPKENKKASAFFPILDKNGTHQADLLIMPEDKKYNYILAIVDVGSRLVDAEALKTKTDLLDAIKKIYNRDILDFPKRLEVDDGSEFKGRVAQFIKSKNIMIRVAKPGRHRSQAVVERYNYLIGHALLKRMLAQEVLTGDQNNEWVDDLPGLITYINSYADKRVKRVKKKMKGEPLANIPKGKKHEDIIPIGTKVRLKLYAPVSATTGKQVFGNFRSADIRYDPQIRTIKKFLINQDAPVMYFLNHPKKKDEMEIVPYSRHELQIVDENETIQNGKQLIRGKPNHYVIEKFIGKKKVGRKTFLKVKWLGFDEMDATYEPLEKLQNDVPDMVAEYLH